MHVSPEEEQVIENGNVVVYTVEIMDKSGNLTTEPKATVACKVLIFTLLPQPGGIVSGCVCWFGC